jgi:hypothetical protein
MNNMIIYPQGTIFYSPSHNISLDVLLAGLHKNIYAVHWHAAAWIYEFKPIKKIINQIKQNKYIRIIFRKKPIVTLDEIIKQRRAVEY